MTISKVVELTEAGHCIILPPPPNLHFAGNQCRNTPLSIRDKGRSSLACLHRSYPCSRSKFALGAAVRHVQPFRPLLGPGAHHRS